MSSLVEMLVDILLYVKSAKYFLAFFHGESPKARAPSPVPDDLPGRVEAAGTHHTAAGVRRRAAQIEPLHRGPVVGVTRYRAEAEHVRQAHRPLHDIAAGDAPQP